MDDAIDEMQKTAGAVDLYDVTEFEPEMRDIAGIIVDAAPLTAEALPLLRNIGAHGSSLHELIERLVRMERSEELTSAPKSLIRSSYAVVSLINKPRARKSQEGSSLDRYKDF